MSGQDQALAHVERLRRWRGIRDREAGLGFLEKQFRQQVERPYRQLQAIVPIWAELVPPEVAGHARLESFSRGVLRVAVDSSARLYELDRLLRSGLERELRAQYRGAGLRRVQLRVDESAAPVDR
ncbi:MAG: hypothetical protein CMJ18_12960 [Phycisphaeraceae bacterium]|nr:hypothetical protein [Phycisphaeraceae bacterium]